MDPITIGALAPLSPPGWVEAGRHLLAGLELGVHDVNAAAERPIELVVRDTAADPSRAAAAVDELARLGATAVVGEYHSVAARAAAARAESLGLPFLCSSAVLHELTEQPATWVARLAPPQSRGWRAYADFLLKAGHRRIAVVTDPSVYWAAGLAILREHLAPRGATITEVPAAEVCDARVASRATALLLLVGHPEPALSIVRAVRGDARLGGLLIGAPAGQPELSEWATSLGAGIPFLRYLPERLTALGVRVESALRERLGAAPSFVAFEGYDAMLVVAAGAAWSDLALDGTRGRIAFARDRVWQWREAPIQIVDRDPADPERFRVLSQC
jgi:ABC-type branched-subunit amino acid transport system substrate-binding protein